MEGTASPGSWTASPRIHSLGGRFMGSFVFLKVEHCGTWELNFLLFLKGYVGVGCCSCHCMIPSFHFDTPRPTLPSLLALRSLCLQLCINKGNLRMSHELSPRKIWYLKFCVCNDDFLIFLGLPLGNQRMILVIFLPSFI